MHHVCIYNWCDCRAFVLAPLSFSKMSMDYFSKRPVRLLSPQIRKNTYKKEKKEHFY